MSSHPETGPGGAAIRQISSRVVYQNSWLQLREDVVERPDQSQGIYAYIQKPDFALVIPVEDGGFHLVEQYRYPVSHRSWEFPQGTMPNRQNADPAELARRELAEETGFRARHIQRVGYLHAAKGMSSQAFTVFIAAGLEAGQHAREPEEQDMCQRWFSRAELERMIQDGIITDSPTISAYLLYLFSDRR